MGKEGKNTAKKEKEWQNIQNTMLDTIKKKEKRITAIHEEKERKQNKEQHISLTSRDIDELSQKGEEIKNSIETLKKEGKDTLKKEKEWEDIQKRMLETAKEKEKHITAIQEEKQRKKMR